MPDYQRRVSVLAIAANWRFRFVPRVVIPTIAATATKAAIKPYSIAVAPSSRLMIF
jgi:hypothetical protein